MLIRTSFLLVSYHQGLVLTPPLFSPKYLIFIKVQMSSQYLDQILSFTRMLQPLLHAKKRGCFLKQKAGLGD